MTDDLKKLVKQARLVGVHVSPTVIFNVCVVRISNDERLTIAGHR